MRRKGGDKECHHAHTRGMGQAWAEVELPMEVSRADRAGCPKNAQDNEGAIGELDFKR
jgi:hypothetical protein